MAFSAILNTLSNQDFKQADSPCRAKALAMSLNKHLSQSHNNPLANNNT